MGALGIGLRVLGGINAAVPAIGSIVSGLKRMTPRIEDEVTVKVEGQPGSTKRQLYFLALATASSLVRRYDIFPALGPPPGMLMLEYDAADHWVQVTLRYNTNLATAHAATVIGPALAQLGPALAAAVGSYINGGAVNNKPVGLYSKLAVFSGPADEVVGAPFNFTGELVPGVPASARAAGAPKLPWDNLPILTTAPVCQEPLPGSAGPIPIRLIPTPNPKPPGDNRGRGVVVTHGNPADPNNGLATEASFTLDLVGLVTAALTDPGGQSLETFIPPYPGPKGV